MKKSSLPRSKGAEKQAAELGAILQEAAKRAEKKVAAAGADTRPRGIDGAPDPERVRGAVASALARTVRSGLSPPDRRGRATSRPRARSGRARLRTDRPWGPFEIAVNSTVPASSKGPPAEARWISSRSQRTSTASEAARSSREGAVVGCQRAQVLQVPHGEGGVPRAHQRHGGRGTTLAARDGPAAGAEHVTAPAGAAGVVGQGSGGVGHGPSIAVGPGRIAP
ncbi:hypothetical protein [Brachybacterium sp. GPGPB12]|uniref:hypothetical protein n=1 Tax=Brachybacterium sp. GPGPB12 TaxID=3023517 RepID=UPI003134581D